MLRLQSKKRKCAGTDENTNAPPLPKQRQTKNLKQARKPMRALYISTDMNASISDTYTTSLANNRTDMNDENQNYEKAPASSTTSIEKKDTNKTTCNMCKNAENTCVNLSNNHCTVVSFSEIIRLPSWSIRQILTSICSRCLVYIGALTESCKNVRLRCEKSLQDQNLPSAPPTPDISPHDILQVAIPSPRDLSDVNSPLIVTPIVTNPVSPSQRQQHTTREASNSISRSPSPNNYIGNEAMLEIHHESPRPPLTTESGGDNNRGNYQLLSEMRIKLICKFCNREYQHKHYFNKHVRHCSKKFRGAKSLGTGVCSENRLGMANDRASVASDVSYRPITLPPRKFHCNVCPITVDSLTKLWQHKRIHYKRFYCDICAKECTTQVDYDFHRAECTSQVEALREMDDETEQAQQMPARRKTRSYSRACSGISCAPAKTSPLKEPNTAKRKQPLPKDVCRTNKKLQSKQKKKEKIKLRLEAEQDTLYKMNSTANQSEQDDKEEEDRSVHSNGGPTKSTKCSRKLYNKVENSQNCADAVSTITNYVQRHKELYTSPDQYYEDDKTGLTTTTFSTHYKEAEKAKQYEEAQSTITNYVQRHKELYRTLSADGSRFNSTLYSEEDDDGEDEDIDDNCDSLFSNRLTLTNQWVEIHSSPSTSHLSQRNDNTSNYDLPCQTIREYDLYMLERLKREVKQKSITCFEPNCGFTAFSLNDMMLHDYIDHYKKPRFYCRKCGNWFTSKIFLHYHLDMQDYGRYVCYKCACKFTRQRQLDLHLIQHDKHNAVVQKTKCHHCRFEFLNKEQLLQHCAKENHNWRRKGMLIKINRAMTIKNKLKRRRSTYKSKHTVHIINMHTEPMPSKRCTPMEKYQAQLRRPWISHRIGKVEFDNHWKPNCV